MWDWWTLKKRHTPYEWALQTVGDVLDPIGLTRDDLRGAIHTAELIRYLAPGINDTELAAIADKLQYYKKFDVQDDDSVVLPERSAEPKS